MLAGPEPLPHHPLWTYYSSFDAEELIRRYTPATLIASKDMVTNFLGVKIPPEVMPSILQPMVGTIEPPPRPGNWHADVAEWASALLSVSTAQKSYQIIELGCGWGCWLNNMGVVATRSGLEVSLVGVEGDQSHLDIARETLSLNGIREESIKLIHGIAAEKEGRAFFPLLDNPSEQWGAEAVFFPTDAHAEDLIEGQKHIELRCVTLEELSGSIVTDLLHIDIQGAELSFVRGNFGAMNKTVKRCLIGTHSREIDGALISAFHDEGWVLEMERPTIHEIVNGFPEVRIDGVQLWRNSNFDN